MGADGTTVLLGVATRSHGVEVLFIRGWRRMSVCSRRLQSWAGVHDALQSVVASYVCWLRGRFRALDVGLPPHCNAMVCWNRHLYILAESDVVKISLDTGTVVERLAHPCTGQLTEPGKIDVTMYLAVTPRGSLAIAHCDNQRRYVAFRCPHTGVWSQTPIPGDPGYQCWNLVMTEDSIALHVSTWASEGGHLFRIVNRHTQAVRCSKNTWLMQGMTDLALLAALQDQFYTVRTRTCSVCLCNATGHLDWYACKVTRLRDSRVVHRWNPPSTLGFVTMLLSDYMEPPAIVAVLDGGNSRVCVLE